MSQRSQNTIEVQFLLSLSLANSKTFSSSVAIFFRVDFFFSARAIPANNQQSQVISTCRVWSAIILFATRLNAD
jgi:hypothetical protein